MSRTLFAFLAAVLGLAPAWAPIHHALASSIPVSQGAQQVMADFSGDGQLDTAWIDDGYGPTQGAVWVALGDGKGGFKVSTQLGAGDHAWSIAAADFNGDGKPDLAILYAGRVVIYPGKGDGTFGPAIVAAVPNDATGGIAAGDLNGDGRVDLVLGGGGGHLVTVLLGNGDGTLGTPMSYGAAPVPVNRVLLGDLNGDGRLDVVVDDGSAVYEMLGNGDGSFGSARTILPRSASCGTCTSLLADVNGDGKLDAVSDLGGSSNLVVLLPGRGDGSFAGAQQVAAGVYLANYAGDLNRDGRTDLIGYGNDGYGNPTLVIMTQSPDGTFRVSSSTPTAWGFGVAGIADVDGDGNPDVVTARDRPLVFLGNGDGTLRSFAPTGSPWTGGSDATGTPSPSRDAYFAEGYTGQNFREYLLIQNPGAAQTATVQYLLASGQVITQTTSLPAQSRTTIDVNSDLGPGLEVSAHVSAPNPIIVERAMYFNYLGSRDGGDVEMGAQALGQSFFFAEGYTGPGFDEYLTLMNPGSTTANVSVTYYYPNHPTITMVQTVKPTSRLTVRVNDVATAAPEVSMKVTSDQPIDAERPMYFDFLGRTGGHVARGTPVPSAHLDLAEGYVDPDFNEFLTILNPGGTAASVTITYFAIDGSTRQQGMLIPAQTRQTVNVNFAVPSGAYSVHVDSDQGLVIERPMYFQHYQNHNGCGPWNNPGQRDLNGGHDAVAVDDGQLGKSFSFAEGYVARCAFDEYLTVLNRNPSPAHLVITYYLTGGGTQVVTRTAAASSRFTEYVNADLGAGTPVSATITSDQPILAERPMYFSYLP